jgi:hypothetical protein
MSEFTAIPRIKSAATSEEHTSSCNAAVCTKNIYVEVDVVCQKKRGERAVDIARAIKIPAMMIHTILKGV